jgi:hypothetical protein
MIGNSVTPVRVNRAPVLTLWAAVVAERLGHPPDTALSLASAVAGTAARAKARRLGLSKDRDQTKAATAGKPQSTMPQSTIRLLGRDIPLAQDDDGIVLADAGQGKPAPAAPVAVYISKAFGNRLDEVRAVMVELAGRIEPQELNRIGFQLYERFRPDVPAEVKGWGAKGELHLGRITGANE